jgi:membrane protease YdiL (CAAX protease family)
MAQEASPIRGRNILTRIFLSPDKARLRAGWRLLLQILLIGIINFILVGVIGILGIPKLSGKWGLLFRQIQELIVYASSIYIASRWLDRRSFESLGLKVGRQALFDLLAGIGIVLVQLGFIYGIMSSLGWLTFDGFAWEFDAPGTVLMTTLLFFVIFLLVGWNEELLSRGYHLQTIASGLNMFWAVLISSAFFGLLHLDNPHATWVSTAGIFFAGVYQSYGYIRTRQLWLPIGLHVGWNFFEGVVFGFPVSGLDIYALTRIQVTGPVSWTGGAFGPEAGLILLPSLIVGSALIYWFTRNRKNT